MGTQPPQQPLPTFGQCLRWPNCHPSQQLLSSCICLRTDVFRFWATVCETVRLWYRTVVLSCLCVLSVMLVYCGQTVGRIKTKLDTQVGLVPGTLLDGNPAPPPQRGTAPIFGPYLLRPNGCMDQDATRHGARPRPRRLCVRWGHSPPLNFPPILIIVIVISLEHCTVVIGLFKFKFKF